MKLLLINIWQTQKQCFIKYAFFDNSYPDSDRKIKWDEANERQLSRLWLLYGDQKMQAFASFLLSSPIHMADEKYWHLNDHDTPVECFCHVLLDLMIDSNFLPSYICSVHSNQKKKKKGSNSRKLGSSSALPKSAQAHPH